MELHQIKEKPDDEILKMNEQQCERNCGEVGSIVNSVVWTNVMQKNVFPFTKKNILQFSNWISKHNPI